MDGLYTTTCESCENEIVRNGGVPLSVSNLIVTIPTEEQETYEERDYCLCSECRRQVIDFIEGMDEGETRADVTELELTARTLSESGDELLDMADRLRALANGEVTDAEKPSALTDSLPKAVRGDTDTSDEE